MFKMNSCCANRYCTFTYGIVNVQVGVYFMPDGWLFSQPKTGSNQTDRLQTKLKKQNKEYKYRYYSPSHSTSASVGPSIVCHGTILANSLGPSKVNSLSRSCLREILLSSIKRLLTWDL